MITLEKALSWTHLETVKNMINDIYKSRGSCVDCKFLGDRGVYCGKHEIFVPSSGYCWRYEKVENDN